MVRTIFPRQYHLLSFSLILCLVALCFAPTAQAAELGVNYYHESMVSQTWGVPYIPRTTAQVGEDMTKIATISRHVKLYMNPFVDANLPWIQTIANIADQKGFHIVVNMMVDDRQLSDANWNAYSDKVVSACAALNGKVDVILVGNEITLHSPWSDQTIKDKVVALMDRCDAVYNGQISYEEFWYAKDVWYGYTQRPIYFMMYEGLSSFRSNVAELDSRFGANAVIGEWGEDSLDEGTDRGDWWQREQMILRWDAISNTRTPVAYVFALREPNWNAFGILRPDNLERPVWSFLASLGDGMTSQPPVCVPSTEVCDGRDNDCDGNTDEGNVCSTPPPAQSWTIGSLSRSCTLNGASCSVSSDSVAGSCRTVTWNTPSGQVRVQGCDKGDGWAELYKQAYPSGSTFTACFSNGCVTNSNGFARFQPTATPPPAACVPTTEVCDGRDNDCDGQSDEGGVCTAPPSTGWTIGSLSRSCTTSSGCTVVSDSVTGTCRTFRWSTSSGEVRVQGCDKGNGYVELYKQNAPSGLDFTACLANGCVTRDVGFVRYQPTGGSTPPVVPPTGVTLASLPFSSTPSGSKTGDFTEGTCRRVQYTTSAGWAEAKACDKNGGRYEMYFTSGSNQVSICVNSNCVSANNGFVSFNV